ncbi:hypothetical protein ACTXT7_017337 [Hymenolepis weldensis]
MTDPLFQFLAQPVGGQIAGRVQVLPSSYTAFARTFLTNEFFWPNFFQIEATHLMSPMTTFHTLHHFLFNDAALHLFFKLIPLNAPTIRFNKEWPRLTH